MVVGWLMTWVYEWGVIGARLDRVGRGPTLQIIACFARAALLFLVLASM